MFVKFENGSVPVYKLRQGVVVEYDGEYFHIQYVFKTLDGQIKLTMVNEEGILHIMPKFVTWLEPI